MPLWPTQVCAALNTGPSNPTHRSRSAGPASSGQSAEPMPPTRVTRSQSRLTEPSTVGITTVE